MNEPLAVNEKLVRDFSGFSGRLGVFGGSFDPVHEKHLEIACSLLGRRVDNVVFIPAAQNPLKVRRPSAGEDRLAMLLLAVQDHDHLFVSAMELDRGSTSYTVETLRDLRQQTNPNLELVWILGSDCLAELPLWVSVEEIFKLAQVVIVQRDQGKTLEQWNSTIADLPLSDFARRQLANNFQPREPNQISSTDIRLGIAKQEGFAGVPERVVEYIMQRGLYK